MNILKNLISVVLFLTGILSLYLLQTTRPVQNIVMRVEDQANLTKQKISSIKNIKGQLITYTGKPSLIKNSWPKFRGNKHNNIYSENIRLASDTAAYSKLWEISLGQGYAAPVIMNGCVYITDYLQDENADAIRCFSFDTGEEIWRRTYKTFVKRNHGMSRTVPAVNADYIVSIGPKCHVICCDALTGKYMWGISLVNDYETEVPLWYAGQCPLIDNGQAIIAPGGKALIIGIDLKTGNKLWETPNPRLWKMSHSSIIPMTIHNKKMYIYAAVGGIAGISAESADRGEILWSSEEWNHSVVAPSPVAVADNRIFLTAGYGVGSMMLQIKKENEKYQAEVLYTWPTSVFACEQQTPIYDNQYLYSILPNDAGPLKRQMVCMDLDGNIKWTSGKDNRYGLGPFILADNKFFILDDYGTLYIAEQNTKEYKLISKKKFLEGKESWGPIAIADGKMLIRDFETMICLDIKK